MSHSVVNVRVAHVVPYASSIIVGGILHIHRTYVKEPLFAYLRLLAGPGPKLRIPYDDKDIPALARLLLGHILSGSVDFDKIIDIKRYCSRLQVDINAAVGYCSDAP